MNKVLNGIRVVDFTLFAAGPSCGKMLADWGAEVIKVEPTTGEQARYSPGKKYNPTFEAYNSNKKGIALNMKTDEGKEIMNQLLSTADVFLTSYRTDALCRLQLDYPSVSALHPKIIWAQINGFGDKGPDAAKPGFDTVAFWARSGAMRDFVEAGNGVMNVPIAFGDVSTACSLAAGICAALYRRTVTGQGEKVQASLYGQAIFCLNNTIITIQDGDKYPKTRKRPIAPLMNSFRCKDDQWIVITAIEYERFYQDIFKIIGRDDLIAAGKYATYMDAYQHLDELTDILDEGFGNMTQDEAVAKLTQADIAHERVNRVSDIVEDPQAIENHYITEYIARDGRSYQQATSPVQFGEDSIPEHKLAPLVGEHTREVLGTLGYTDEQIEDFVTSGVVKASV